MMNEVTHFEIGYHIQSDLLSVQIVIGALLIATCIWGFVDARRRNRNPFLVVLFLLSACWPLSIVWWHWFRPTVGEAEEINTESPTTGCTLSRGAGEAFDETT